MVSGSFCLCDRLGAYYYGDLGVAVIAIACLDNVGCHLMKAIKLGE